MNKTKFLQRSTLIAAIVMVGVFACTDERNELMFEDDDFTRIVDDAKRLYSAYRPDANNSSVDLRVAKETRPMKVKPSWGDLRVEKNGEYEIMESMIMSEKGFSFSVPEAREKVKKTGDNRYGISGTCIVYRKNRKTGVEDMFLMTIVPDVSYLETCKFDIYKKMSYLSRDKKFSGCILYHNMDGSFANGWRYSAGKVTATMEAQEANTGFELETRNTTTCYTAYIETTTYTNWYTAREGDTWVYTGTSIGSTTYQTLYTTCYSSGSDGGYSGGGGSNNNNKPNTPDTPKTPQEILCKLYHGVLNPESLRQTKTTLNAKQEMFIISLANIAALSELGFPLSDLEKDVENYSDNSSLYTKLNKLNNPSKYTKNWTPDLNSYTGQRDALVSPVFGKSRLRLKYYPQKNGEFNAIGLIRNGEIEHGLEAALELLESIALSDDLLYDMHMFNALKFMNSYCND